MPYPLVPAEYSLTNAPLIGTEVPVAPSTWPDINDDGVGVGVGQEIVAGVGETVGVGTGEEIAVGIGEIGVGEKVAVDVSDGAGIGVGEEVAAGVGETVGLGAGEDSESSQP
jgi:hypothetical protein